MAKVSIVMGSDSDLEVMNAANKILEEFGINYEVSILSAHRTPDTAAKFAKDAEGQGVEVIIAGAGYAAHLAGAIAAHTILPVIGVPLPGSALDGMDALLSTVQMPGGVPVATVTIGKAGAKNAALLAAEILALSDEGLKKKLHEHKAKMAKTVEEKNKKIK